MVIDGANGTINLPNQPFQSQLDHWRSGLSAMGGNDRAELLTVLTNEMTRSAEELWLVFIGHGTFDGHSAKFARAGYLRR